MDVILTLFLILGLGAVLNIIIGKLLKTKTRYGGLIASIFIIIAIAYTILYLESVPCTDCTMEAGILGSKLRVTLFNFYFIILFESIILMATIYSYGYFEDEVSPVYYTLLITILMGMIGVTVSDDLFTLYIFWELMALSSYSLVAYLKNWEAAEAGFKYLVMSTIGSLIVLYSFSIIFANYGTLNIDILSQIMAHDISKKALFIAGLGIAGFSVTAALVPFHTWLPDAHPAAPSPVSAILSGIVIKTGMYAIILLIFSLFTGLAKNLGSLMIAFGLLTMTVANLMVLMQTDIKRFLAYSSIANMGYIAFGVGIASYALSIKLVEPALMAMTGALFHILNHAVSKSLAFLSTGYFIHEAKTRNITELEGIALKMKYTGFSSIISLLNLAGVPPLSGFWGKLFIIIGTLALLSNPLILIGSLLFLANIFFAAGYYLWLIYRITFKENSKLDVKEKSASMITAELILALTCIMITVLIPYFLDFLHKVSLLVLGV